MSEFIKDPRNQALLKEGFIGLIKSVFGAVPYAGTALNEAFFDVRSRVKQARFETLIAELSKRIESTDACKFSTSHLQSEEFSDLLEDIIQKVLKNRSKTKADMFAGILTSAVRNRTIVENPLIDLYIATLASLEEPEIVILRSLYSFFDSNDALLGTMEGAPTKERREIKINYSDENILGVNKNTFRICFESLLSKGLVIDDGIGRFGGIPRSYIKPTVLAMGLLTFISENP